MKKTLVTSLALAVAASAFAQGTVAFATRLTAGSPPLNAPVFAPGTAPNGPDSAGVQKTGNSAAGLPVGTQTYTGAAITGSGWTATLWSINGNVIPAGTATPYGIIDSSLLPSPTTTTFRTGTSAGAVAVATATLANVPADAASAVLQMRVFPTSFGTWAAAVAAFDLGNPLAIIGASPMFVVNLIGGSVNTAPQMDNIRSFSLVSPVPEPGTLALAGLGAASLLLFRRKK